MSFNYNYYLKILVYPTYMLIQVADNDEHVYEINIFRHNMVVLVTRLFIRAMIIMNSLVNNFFPRRK